MDDATAAKRAEVPRVQGRYRPGVVFVQFCVGIVVHAVGRVFVFALARLVDPFTDFVHD